MPWHFSCRQVYPGIHFASVKLAWPPPFSGCLGGCLHTSPYISITICISIFWLSPGWAPDGSREGQSGEQQAKELVLSTKPFGHPDALPPLNEVTWEQSHSDSK